MNTDRQRIKIAEACGLNTKHVRAFVLGHSGYAWRHFDTQKEAERWDKTFPTKGFKIEEYTNVNLLSDYLNDLNAMHEAEKLLTWEQRKQYHSTLADVAGFSYCEADTHEETELNWNCCICHSTAAQRAEAFLITLDLWESETVAAANESRSATP